MVLVDSSVWIEYLRRPASETGLELDRLLGEKAVVLTGVVMVEVLLGARSKQDFERLASLLGPIPFEEVDKKAWSDTAELGMRLRRSGTPIPLSDLQIASVALQGNHSLFSLA